ncbi:MAG: tetratricopeptide repeat protein [Acidobacteria bacterium]|nr:tetratricopeptide repeat protein [Acidobacteriota bacterium]
MARGRRLGVVLVLSGAIGMVSARPLALSSAPDANAYDRGAALRAKGLDAGYNLDHDEAESAFRQAIAADPAHPAPHRLSAALTWIRILWGRGSITVDEYFGRLSGDIERRDPPADLASAFRTSINQAITIAEARLRERPDDADAHFHVGAAYGLLSVYQQSIEGRIGGGLGTARRAVKEQERALTLDPRRKDAGLQLGLYRYGVSTLALPLRMVAGAFGLGGGRARGIRLVEEAAGYPSELQTNARLALLAIYNREGRYDEALGLLTELQRRYPRNRLLWFEAAAAALRAGRPSEATLFNGEGMKKVVDDRRPKAPGEEELWQRQRATIQLTLTQARHR